MHAGTHTSVLKSTHRNTLNSVLCLMLRSPAEGAYSEGFIASKFTQDFCIECPATSSLFSLKTGEIVTWYPNNPVLRALTPQDTCRNLQIYPVKLTQVGGYPSSQQHDCSIAGFHKNAG